jgi:DNA-binding NarL/FixJ family response regulator
MVSIISLAYSTWGAEGVLGSARHLEAIRRLNDTFDRLTTESERAVAEAQLLFGIQTYAITDGFPDLALERGAMGHRAARAIGDQTLEFATARGLAETHLQLDEMDEAGRWLDRAGIAAAAAPTPLRSRLLEHWRGVLAARRGDADGLIEHLERAAGLAADQGRMAARCATLACLATEGAALGLERRDARLLEIAERAAGEAAALAPSLSGDPIWPLQARAALVDVRLGRDRTDAAIGEARDVAQRLFAVEGHAIHPEIALPVARALTASAAAEDQQIGRRLAQEIVGVVAERIVDPGVAKRWLAGRRISELVELAGGVDEAVAVVRTGPMALIAQRLPKLPLDLSPEDTGLVRMVMEGQTDAEIGQQLSVAEDQVADRLAGLFGRMGAPSRSVATLYGFMAGII